MNSTVSSPMCVHLSAREPAVTAWFWVQETSRSPTRIIARPSRMPSNEIVVSKIRTVEPLPPSVTRHSLLEQDMRLTEFETDRSATLLATEEPELLTEET